MKNQRVMPVQYMRVVVKIAPKTKVRLALAMVRGRQALRLYRMSIRLSIRKEDEIRAFWVGSRGLQIDFRYTFVL
jgi:hypothetical protein